VAGEGIVVGLPPAEKVERSNKWSNAETAIRRDILRAMSLRLAGYLSLVLLVLSACGQGSPAPTASATGLGPAEPVSPAGMTAVFTIRVDAPNSTPAGDLVYIAGDFQGWNPASPTHALAKQPDGRWTIDLNLTAGQPIQFKFTHGSWTRVEKDATGLDIPNRMLTPQAGQTYDFTVTTWADLGTLTGDVEMFSHSPFRGGRTVRVYLPPGYRTSTDRYPVLYMHDGQNLYDVRTSFAGEWRVDETCDLLVESGQIRPVIVVGVDNGGGARLSEYTPWPSGGSGGDGEAYLIDLITLLKPEIDRRYRTLADRTQTFMSGSSLGGLISTYAGWAHDDVFGRVAAVSPSYWWDNDHLIGWAQAQGKPALTRFYQDMGTLESGSTTDQDGNGIDDYIDDLRAMRAVALGQGFVDELDFRSIEAAGQSHNEGAWAQRFPALVTWLVGQWPASGVPE